MLRGDPGRAPPAMRSALRLLLAGLLLLGSLPCRGAAAASPSSPPFSLTVQPVTTPSPSAVASTSVTSAKLAATTGALTSRKPTAPLISPAPLSPTSSGLSKTLAAGTSSSTPTPLPTGHGAPTVPSTPVAGKTTPRAPMPTLGSSPTSNTSLGGAASKDLTSTSSPSTSSLLPTSPSPSRPVGSTAKSPGPPAVPTSILAVPGIGRGSTTLQTVATAKETTSKDKISALTPTSVPGISKTPHRSLATTVPNTAGIPRSSTVESSSHSVPAPPDLKITPSTASMVTSVSPEHHVTSPSSGPNLTSVQAQTKIVCENTMPPQNHAIILILNESRPCNSMEGSSLKEALKEMLCRAVKPNFNQSRDECTVWLASDKEDPKKLAVVRVSVQTNSVDEELSEALAKQKTELEKLGVNNITRGGQPLDTEPTDHLSLPLIITIICMAASLLLVAAIYGCCHQRISQRKDQQRLTEELHTIENGYHDNPTLDVMETLSEMQEKKVNLNGELGDSWIVPMDSLTKDDLDEEEDTHL
ncbi:podocalyxin [Candoia aspera]|uniref:podocalyxin n=1 Tax=Candoia aspera TaxID=51853 RepID=UPI002FD83621